LGYEERRCWANCSCNKFPRFSTYVVMIHQRHRETTDRQMDRQTTCDRKTALCTIVHHAVKTIQNTTSVQSNMSSTVTPRGGECTRAGQASSAQRPRQMSASSYWELRYNELTRPLKTAPSPRDLDFVDTWLLGPTRV